MAAARTAFVTISIFAGLLLIPLLRPPGTSARPDLRATVLAATMVAIFAIVLAVPGLREVFELTAMPVGDVLVLAALALAWAAVIAGIRTGHVAGRLLLVARRLAPD